MVSISEFFTALLQPVVYRPLIAALIIGSVCAVIGVFMVLRKLVFFGNGIAHSAFAGGTLGILLNINPMISISFFAIITAMAIGYINQRNKLSNEIAIGVLFSLSMALGILFISLFRTYNTDVSSLLFGSLSSISLSEVFTTVIFAVIILGVLFWVKKELYFVTFDDELAQANGLPVVALSYLFLLAVALTVVMSLNTVGVILVMAFIVTPAATAYQFTYSLNKMLLLSVICAVLSVLLGYMLAYMLDISGGASIVLVLTVLFALSFVFSPKRRQNLPGINDVMCGQCIKLVKGIDCSYCEMDETCDDDGDMDNVHDHTSVESTHYEHVTRVPAAKSYLHEDFVEKDPVIEISNVSVSYNRSSPVLQEINLKIYPGEYIGLIGKNGSGKSTLMKSILGLLKPTTGAIRIFNEPIGSHTYDRIGYMPQMHPIPREFPATVGDVVSMGLFKNHLFRPLQKIDHDKVMLALHKVHMEKFFNRPIGHLSGGEQQKVLVAQALVREPEILLLDEPTSALDFTMVKDFLAFLQHLNHEYGITLIVIQHNLDMLRPYCSRLIMLRGQIVYDGLPNLPKADEMIQKVFYN
jgi:ABC-type Mn2+/Zn2+ transport system ATPase subunit/ABC-type Mn2+/Zn2+ transport system permease subunit